MTVTSRRSVADWAAADGATTAVAWPAVAAGAPGSERPQLPQKRSFGSFSAPQFGQAAASALPQLEQKRRPARFSVPQLVQVTR
jgi:hypothetical protein